MTTTVQTKSAMPESLRGIKVIDIDTHFSEPPDLWTSRAPAGLKDKMPRIKRVGNVDQWVYEDQTMMQMVSINVISSGHEKHRGGVTLNTFEDIDPAAFDARERLKLMDDMNIYAQVVFPNAGGFGGGRFAELMSEDIRNTCVRIYNDALAEFAAESNGRLLPQALVPFWDIKEAANEARRIKEDLKLTGIAAMSEPETWKDLPDYGDRAWDPFWEVCSELEIPICLHIGAGGFTGNKPWKSFSQDVNLDELSSIATSQGTPRMAVVASTALMLSFLNARPLVNLLYSGLFDRWPTLKIVSVESGIGWIPFFLEMAEYQYEEFDGPRTWGLKRGIRDYFRDHFYVSWWFEHVGPRLLLEEVGVNNVLFETDFPHATCLYPDPLDHAAKVLAEHPYEVRKRVMQDNAAELWKIPV